MKVIHTYVSNEIVWKEKFYIMMLSALYAKRHYSNIDLYCSKAQEEQLSKIVPFYSNIIPIELEEKTPYSLPKLKTFKRQKEPFLHLDHDTVLFTKIKFHKSKSPFLFSHPELKSLVKRKGTLGYHLSLLYSNDTDYNYVKHSYLELLDELYTPVKDLIECEIDVESIPNMNVTYVKDYEIFSDASNKAIQYYYSNKELIDGHEFGAHHIEQFLIHHLLLSSSKKYKKAVKKGHSFLIPKVPLTVKFTELEKMAASISDTSFPVSFQAYTHSPFFKEKGLKKYTIETPEDIQKLFKFKFCGYTHFSFLQWYQIWQPYIINEIVVEFGEEYVLSAHEYFKKYYKESNLPTISEGELLYEKVTGNKLFS